MAIRLWQQYGFDIVGTLPDALRHLTLGFVDAHVMFKRLDDRPLGLGNKPTTSTLRLDARGEYGWNVIK